MGIDKYLGKVVSSRTEELRAVGDIKKVSINNIGDVASTVYSAVTTPIILALSDAWIGISLFKPSKTDAKPTPPPEEMKWQPFEAKSSIEALNRWQYDRMWYMQIGDYAMPMSQTFNVRAKKKLNISSLVDGVDIIQQTRKEAKTIDCTLRIAITDHRSVDKRPNLQILKENGNASQSYDGQKADIVKLGQFLQDFYEKDSILRIYNDEINNTFGVQYVIMSDYKFTPRASMGTFTFEFTLVEVAYGDNVLTFNLREIDADAGTRRQIVD